MIPELFWVGWTDEEARLLISTFGGQAKDSESLLACDDRGVLVLPAYGASGTRSYREALLWFQKARRDLLLKNPILVLSFEPRDIVAQSFGFLLQDSSSVAYRRLPIAVNDLESAVKNLRPLNEDELVHAIRWHSGLQEIWAGQVHKLGNALAQWPAARSEAEVILEQLRESVERYAPDQQENLDRLIASMLTPGGSDASLALQDLQDGLNGTGSLELPEAPSNQAPARLSRVLVADDQLRAGAPLLSQLGERGYVCQLASDLPKALDLLSSWGPNVVLCDLGFPTPADGRKLMQEALNAGCPVVIAISKARLAPGDVPAGVVDCSGPSDAIDASRVHRVIWSKAPAGAIPVTRQTAALPRDVDELHSLFRFKALQWRKLPDAIARAVDYAEKLASEAGTPRPVASVARDVANTLTAYRQPNVSHEQVRCLADQTRRLLDQAKALPEWDQSGSLWNAMHATIDQHVHSVARDIDEELDRIESVQEGLKAVAGSEVLLQRLQDVTGLLATDPLTCETTEELANLLREAAAVLPVVEANPMPLESMFHTTKFRLVIAEDDPIWMEFMKSVVQLLEAKTRDRYTFETVYCDTVSSTIKAIQTQPSQCGIGYDGVQVQTIAVLDLAMPKDAAEAASVGRGRATPSRRNGHELVREVRSYRRNIPVIVHTTAPHLLADQLEICAQGVPDCQYVIKDAANPQRLVDAILMYLQRSGVHTIQFGLAPYSVAIDGIGVDLGEMPFRTFYALASLSKGSARIGFSTEDILNELDSLFSDEFDYIPDQGNAWNQAIEMARRRAEGCWQDDWVLHAAQAIHLWCVKSRAFPDDPALALTAFRQAANDRVWRNTIVLLLRFKRAHPDDPCWKGQRFLDDGQLDWDLLARASDRVFGGINVEGPSTYSLDSLERHINEIRKGIHTAFNALHRYIEPREEVLISTNLAGEHMYRVHGDIRLPAHPRDEEPVFETAAGGLPAEDHELASKIAAETTRHAERLRVLVVENEESFSIRIQELLNLSGFEPVLATNTEDAVAAARTHVPNILCLDMHIPLTRHDYRRDPSSGDRTNGLEALRQIREILSDRDFKVLVPTTLSNDEQLRQIAVQLDVPIANFVPKGDPSPGSSWEAMLLATITRLKEEIVTGRLLPPVLSAAMAVVTVLPDTQPSAKKLKVQIGGENKVFRGNQAVLALLLLQNAGEEVPFEEIERSVWGETPPTTNARRQLIKHVRTGFNLCAKLPGPRDEDVEGDLIITTRDQSRKPRGLRLNAYVNDPEGRL